MVGVAPELSCAVVLVVSISGWSSSSSSLESSSYTPNQCAPGLTLGCGAWGVSFVVRWRGGAVREVAGVGVEALASVDEEDSGLCRVPLRLMGCWADPGVG